MVAEWNQRPFCRSDGSRERVVQPQMSGADAEMRRHRLCQWSMFMPHEESQRSVDLPSGCQCNVHSIGL